MLKKIITLFFLLIFVSQSLRVCHVSNMAYRYDLTDELPESESSKTTGEVKWLISFHGEYVSANELNDSSAFYIHFTDILPAHYYGDVQTPPPDQLS